jgi:hypothetical protein
MQHHRQEKAGQIAVSGRLLVATVVGACSSGPRACLQNPEITPCPRGRQRSGCGPLPFAHNPHSLGTQEPFPTQEPFHSCPHSSCESLLVAAALDCTQMCTLGLARSAPLHRPVDHVLEMTLADPLEVLKSSAASARQDHPAGNREDACHGTVEHSALDVKRKAQLQGRAAQSLPIRIACANDRTV